MDTNMHEYARMTDFLIEPDDPAQIELPKLKTKPDGEVSRNGASTFAEPTREKKIGDGQLLSIDRAP